MSEQNKQIAVKWLEQELNENYIDSMPIDDIRWKLHSKVGGVKQFHEKIAQLLNIDKLKEGTKDIVQWISPTWKPMWAGEKPSSHAIPEQKQTYSLKGGEFSIRCNWNSKMIEISWSANTQSPSEFWVQFVDPETKEIFSTVKLGKKMSGKKSFEKEELKFDFTNVKWALHVLFKDI